MVISTGAGCPLGVEWRDLEPTHVRMEQRFLDKLEMTVEIIDNRDTQA